MKHNKIFTLIRDKIKNHSIMLFKLLIKRFKNKVQLNSNKSHSIFKRIILILPNNKIININISNQD
jgi:hypothetical protein